MLLNALFFFPLVLLHWITYGYAVAGAHIPYPWRLDRRTATTRDANHYYNFNAAASDNVAVYFGQTDATGRTSLASMCQDPSVDIVILGFVTKFSGQGGYPEVNFGAACDGQTPQMQAQAQGLLHCPSLASQISTCQSMNKKVLLSIGGWLSSTAFSSELQATGMAKTLWNLFGAGTDLDPGLRPFDNVKVDGFDIDKENKQPAHYGAFAKALRTQYARDPSKPYYLSAAPQCPRPDASIPLDVLRHADFVWVQFYNNPVCNIDAPGFDNSFAAWSSDLTAAAGYNGRPAPKLFIGAPAFEKGGTGYVSAQRFASVVQKVTASGAKNFGGVMLWDGAEARFNVDYSGRTYMQSVKAALVGR